jgi:hypothetical protein
MTPGSRRVSRQNSYQAKTVERGGKTVEEKELSRLRMIDSEFQGQVLEKLGRLEARMEMLAGNGQPGRVQLAEDRIIALERNDVRRTVIERFVNAGIAIFISAAIALHGRWLK